MKTLMKEKYGNLKSLNKIGKLKNNSFTTEQLLDKKLKNVDGENRMEVTDRMEKSFERVFSENIGKNIVIVSHGASIKFLLMKWCKLNIYNQIEFKNKVINLNSPGVLELLFEDKELIKLTQIV